MTTFAVAYRVRVYAPRSVDPAELTIMTPAAGAPHSQPFLVATASGVSDSHGTYRPFLKLPTGRKGRLDALSGQSDTGQITLELVEAAVAGITTHRWGTAFLGNAQGVTQFLGQRVEIDESADLVSWTLVFGGRISKAELTSRLLLQFTVRDLSDDMATSVFVGLPHTSITYAGPAMLLPNGLPVPYGPLGPPAGLLGKIIGAWQQASSAPWTAAIGVDSSATPKNGNILTDAYMAIGVSGGPPGGYSRGRVRITRQDTQLSGWFNLTAATGAPTGPGSTMWTASWQSGAKLFDGTHYQLTLFEVGELPSTDPRYMAMPPVGTSVTFQIFPDLPPTDGAPFYIGDIDPVQLAMDLLNGKFGYFYRATDTLPPGKSVGDPLRTFPYDSTFSTLLGTRPKMRFCLTQQYNLDEFLQKYVCLPNALAYVLTDAGNVSLVDLSTPTSVAGLPTLVDNDLEATDAPLWELDRSTAVVRMLVKWYIDHQPGYQEMMAQGDQFPKVTSATMAAMENDLLIQDFGNADLGDTQVEVDAIGRRILDVELTGALAGPAASIQAIQQQLYGTLLALKRPFGSAAQYATVTCRRTATTLSLQAGALTLVAVSSLMDASQNIRGGTRLARVAEYTKQGAHITMRLLDLGLGGAAAVPTVGALALDSADTRHIVDVPITLNANSDPVTVRYNVTATSISAQPVDSDPGWLFVQQVKAAGTIAVPRLPAGMRIWVEARSEPSAVTEALMPSAWATAATAHIDTAALTAASGLAAPTVGATTTTITWTPPDTVNRIQVLLGGSLVATLAAGSNSYQFTGLTASTGYTAAVQAVDGNGGVSAQVTVGFTTNGTDASLPTPTTLQVLVGV